MNRIEIVHDIFEDIPLPELSEKDGSPICKLTVDAIFHHNNEELQRCINEPSFDVNERFDTSYKQRENYLGYAFYFGNNTAIKEFSENKKPELSLSDVEEMTKLLLARRRYLLLHKTLKQFDAYVSMFDYFKSILRIEGNGRFKRYVH